MTRANSNNNTPSASENAATSVSNTTEAPTTTLQVQDLQNLLQIVDYAAEQGVFKGWNTISQVFAVRQKLNAFLQSIAPKTDVSEQKAEGENLEMNNTDNNHGSNKEDKVTKLSKKKKG